MSNDVRAPTTRSETAAIAAAATTAPLPPRKKKGMSGRNAPNANITNDEIAAPHGEPSPSSGSIPSSSLACVSSAIFGSRISSSETRSARSRENPFRS